VFIDGRLVAEQGHSLLPRVEPAIVNKFDTPRRNTDEFRVSSQAGSMLVIEAIDGQLVTDRVRATPRTENGQVVQDIDRDLLKIVLCDRYGGGKPAVAFVRSFGLKHGAIASSVSHDSHNIIAVGTRDDDLAAAINAIIEVRGGISVANGGQVDVLPLPIAGLMSAGDGHQVAADYSRLDRLAKELGSQLRAPFMTLSFMALTVIPELKLGPEGLFDVASFSYVPLFE
jgi:adenine deaminase